MKPAAQVGGFAASLKRAEDAFCHGKALCTALKAACKGEYVVLVPSIGGKCIDPKPATR